jgi:phenylalanyl-tRNA synthetase beta subunit
VHLLSKLERNNELADSTDMTFHPGDLADKIRIHKVYGMYGEIKPQVLEEAPLCNRPRVVVRMQN